MQRGQATTIYIIIGIIILGLIGGVIYYSQQNPQEETVEIPETTEQIETEEDSGEVLEDPENYVGSTVEVGGEVQSIYASNAFILEEDELFDTEILVVTQGDISDLIENTDVGTFVAEDRARVSGTLRPFTTVEEIETDLSITLDPQVEVEYQTGYYIEAASIEVNPTE